MCNPIKSIFTGLATLVLLMVLHSIRFKAGDAQYAITSGDDSSYVGPQTDCDAPTDPLSCDDKFENFFRMFKSSDNTEAIEAVEIEILREEMESYARLHGSRNAGRLRPVRTVITDVHDIEVFAKCFDNRACLRGVFLKGQSGGTTILVLGRIQFKAPETDYTLWVTDFGFSLSEHAPFEDLFFSSAGAHVLAMHYSRCSGGAILSTQLMDALDGTANIARSTDLFKGATWKD